MSKGKLKTFADSKPKRAKGRIKTFKNETAEPTKSCGRICGLTQRKSKHPIANPSPNTTAPSSVSQPLPLQNNSNSNGYQAEISSRIGSASASRHRYHPFKRDQHGSDESCLLAYTPPSPIYQFNVRDNGPSKFSGAVNERFTNIQTVLEMPEFRGWFDGNLTIEKFVQQWNRARRCSEAFAWTDNRFVMRIYANDKWSNDWSIIRTNTDAKPIRYFCHCNKLSFISTYF